MIIKKRLSLNFLYGLLISLICFSCRKDSSDVQSKGTNLLVNVKVIETIYDDYGTVGHVTANNIAQESIQSDLVEVSDDIVMISELQHISSKDTSPETIKRDNSSSSTSEKFTVSLNKDALYKILVFKKDGTYVTEREYMHHQEEKTEKLLLDGGDYIFIAYSLNSTLTLPMLSYYDDNSNNKHLSNIYINALDVEDMLFERIDMQLHIDKNNDLNLIFRHKFNYITTVIDASQTKYNLASVSAYLSPIYPNAMINFSDGSISRSGIPKSVPLSFKRKSLYEMEADGVVINAPSDTNLLTITGMTVGPFVSEYQIPFRNLKLIPGARYRLLVRLIPKDKYIDNYNGHPVVQINGVLWMRHNLGANEAMIDVENSITESQHGNFYQWGRDYPLASGISNHEINSPPPSWEPYVNLTPTAWNKGTEQRPLKGDRDPCPKGFRIPTLLELDSLRKGTEVTVVGDWNGSVDNYNAGVLFRSIRDKDVFITLPAQGAYAPMGIDGDGLPGAPEFRFGGLVYRAEWVAYWASYLDINGSNMNKGLVGRLRVTTFNNIPRVEVSYRSPASTENTVGAYPIRCVAE